MRAVGYKINGVIGQCCKFRYFGLMKIQLLAAIALLFVLLSCEKPNQTVKVKNKYSLELPAFLEEATGLHKQASLQYSSTEKGLYVLVIDEEKAPFNATVSRNPALGYTPNLEGYSKLGVDHMAEATLFEGTPVFKNTTVNGLPARTITITGLSKNINGYWFDAYVEGADSYYHIVTWTTTAHKAENEKQMQEIISSFKEYDKVRK